MKQTVLEFHKTIENDYAKLVDTLNKANELHNTSGDDHEETKKAWELWHQGYAAMIQNFTDFKASVKLSDLSLEELFNYLSAIQIVEENVDVETYLIECYGLIVKIDKKNTEILFKLAETLRKKWKQPAKAIAAYNKILKIRPDHDPSLYGKSICLNFQGEKKSDGPSRIEALRLINQAIALNPNDPAYRKHKITLLDDFDGRHTVEGYHKHVKDAYLEFYESKRELRRDQLECYRHYLAHVDKNSRRLSSDLSSKISLLRDFELWEEIVDDCDRLYDALEHENSKPKKFISLYANKAEALTAMGRLDEAIASYLEGLKLTKNKTVINFKLRIYKNLADIYRRQKDTGKMEQYIALFLEENAQENPNWPPNVTSRADFLQEFGRLAEAKESYQIALKLCKTKNTPQFREEIESKIRNLARS